MERHSRALSKQEEQARAANEVALYENYVELLTSLHKDAGDAWNWNQLLAVPPPPAPPRFEVSETRARQELGSYKPGMLDKMLGRDKKQIAALEDAVSRARAQDEAAYQDAVRKHQHEHHLCEYRRGLARRVLGRDPGAYREALDHASAFAEVVAFRSNVILSAAEPDVVAITCAMTPEEMIPTEESKLTAGGKLSTKALPQARYWALYQDHVCSVAIRLAREVYAVLPLDRVIVNIGQHQLNASTGHHEAVTILAVHFLRAKLTSLNLQAIDPSDSMKNFSHRMKFKKTAGFEPVQPITTDEQWVTT